MKYRFIIYIKLTLLDENFKQVALLLIKVAALTYKLLYNKIIRI
jgi:hypothetical protein